MPDRTVLGPIELPQAHRSSVIRATLFGSSAEDLDPADLDVAQTAAHVATVALLQEQAPSADTVAPRLHRALSAQVVVEQAKGVVRARLRVTVEQALELLRMYSRARGEHLTQLCTTVMSDPHRRSRDLDDLAHDHGVVADE